ncbi:MAG: cyclic nucleotide-binding domain-containing protein [Elusimicrobia bacterium]|nr:cyclic nucleotide-binding domain-containing protein [Elusimicrobiota bacterium]
MKLIGLGVSAGPERDFLMSELRGLDLFAPLTDEQLRKMLYFVKSVEFEDGEIVFEKGDPGEWFYLIHRGEVEIFEPGFFGPSVLARMGPGDFFGELALILSQPRSAGVRCVGETACFALDRTDLETLMERSPDIAAAIKQIAQQRFGS